MVITGDRELYHLSYYLGNEVLNLFVHKLPVSAIAEILYCPRNFYYRVVENAPDLNKHLLEGKWQEELREERKTQTRADRKQFRNVRLESDFYGISGIIDVVEEKDGSLYPIENKKGPLRENINDDVQICLQALLLEEYLQKDLQRGYVYYVESASRRVVFLSTELRELTIHTIESAHQIIRDNIIPEPVNDRRCIGCSLAARCLPEESGYLKTGLKKPTRPMASANLGRVLLIDTPGAYLSKKEGRIIVTKDKKLLKDVPITTIDQVNLIGPISISTPLMQDLLKRSIPVHFGTTSGKHLGWLNPTLNKNSLLRLAQAKSVDKPDLSLSLAKSFVKGKISNMRTILLRHNRLLKNECITNAIEQIGKLAKKISLAENKQELLGIEGNCTKEYFNVFHLLVKKDEEFFFKGRNRRPPRDPINVMLSYGYTLLSNEIINELLRVGLDPYYGFFHSNIYGRPALALDLMEEFRAIIVDSAVLSAINNGMVDKDDFEFVYDYCQMNEKGRKAFFKAYRNRINEEITHPFFGYKVSYRRIIELQARFLSKVLTGDFEEYQPFLVR